MRCASVMPTPGISSHASQKPIAATASQTLPCRALTCAQCSGTRGRVGTSGALCFPLPAMLDPRALAERRDEILESCRRRGARVDVDAAVAAYEQVAALQTELNEANRRRNEHQESGKRKLPPEEREAHTALGRRLKDAVGALEERLAAARGALDERLASLPNFVHPDAPVGGEADARELRRVGQPPRFDFAPQDH